MVKDGSLNTQSHTSFEAMAKREKGKKSPYADIFYSYEDGAKSPFRAWFYIDKLEKDGSTKSRPVKKRFAKERDRDTWAKEIDAERRESGQKSQSLNPARRKQWEHADAMLDPWEDPVDVVRQWRDTHPRLRERPSPKSNGPTANQIIDAFYESHGKEPDFVSNIYDSHMERFRSKFGDRTVKWLCDNRREIAAWIEGLNFAPYTKRNQKGRVAVAFSEALADGLITENPFARLKVKTGKKPTVIRYLAVDDCIALFAANFHLPGTCAKLAIGLLGGLRSSAVSRVEHLDFRLEIPALSIPDWKAKTGVGDLVEGWPDAVWEWVKYAKPEDLAPSCENVEDLPTFFAWKNKLDKEWKREKSAALCRADLLVTREDKIYKNGSAGLKSPPRNWARHSFGTFHAAAYNDLGLTSALMSHAVSVMILRQHYKGVATKAEAQRFFAITPSFIERIILKKKTS